MSANLPDMDNKYFSLFSMGDRATGVSIKGARYPLIDFTLENKSRVTYHKSPTNSGGIREIDDNLPSPSAVNFIPLMKI